MKTAKHTNAEKLAGVGIEGGLEWVSFFSEVRRLAALSRARRGSQPLKNLVSKTEPE
jgi:hypothetical protein